MNSSPANSANSSNFLLVSSDKKISKQPPFQNSTSIITTCSTPSGTKITSNLTSAIEYLNNAGENLEKNPSQWFNTLENHLKNLKLDTDLQKYSMLLAYLNQKYIKQFHDAIVANPKESSEGSRYKFLKETIIGEFERYLTPKAKEMISQEKLGGRKPSKFLESLLLLRTRFIPYHEILQTWNKGLPLSLQCILLPVLKNYNESNISELGKLSDEILELQNQLGKNSRDTRIFDIEKFKEEMKLEREAKEREMKKLNDLLKQRMDKNEKLMEKLALTTINLTKTKPLCWYHEFYGENAHYCIEPCGWNKK